MHLTGSPKRCIQSYVDGDNNNSTTRNSDVPGKHTFDGVHG